ncbi:unnamed protein product [Dracunculus medinensis]|uniref:Reverse transcriptase domain-containing protein n=1 Tax=Dracunculus medinensis TaxID=318479 RepID=A0A0N4UBL2_DRAME|nr:unnamed protein product [Dracunculus medinensis]
MRRYTIDWIIESAYHDSRSVSPVNPEHCTTDFEYADDLILFADSYDEMQVMLNKVSDTAVQQSPIQQ